MNNPSATTEATTTIAELLASVQKAFDKYEGAKKKLAGIQTTIDQAEADKKSAKKEFETATKALNNLTKNKRAPKAPKQETPLKDVTKNTDNRVKLLGEVIKAGSLTHAEASESAKVLKGNTVKHWNWLINNNFVERAGADDKFKATTKGKDKYPLWMKMAPPTKKK